MFRVSVSNTTVATVANQLHELRIQVLDAILRGVFVIWLLALVVGINSVISAYERESPQYENPLVFAAAVIGLYVSTTIGIAFATFGRRLGYNLRAGILLVVLYCLGALQLPISAFSGDGRAFLFAFVVLTSILLDVRAGLVALGLSLLTMGLTGWQISLGTIEIPIERQANAARLSAWMSGSLIFLVLGAAVLISTHLLLQQLTRSLVTAQQSLIGEHRLTRIARATSRINALIVRERNMGNLLRSVCEILVVEFEYSFAWVSFIEEDGVTMRQVAASAPSDSEHFVFRMDDSPTSATCMAMAIRHRTSILIEPLAHPEMCSSCPYLSIHSQQSAVALPLICGDQIFGSLTLVPLAHPGVLDEQEIHILEGLANDVAFALTSLKTTAANARLYADLRQREESLSRRVAELELLSHGAAILRRAQHRQELLPSLLDWAVVTLGADAGAVILCADKYLDIALTQGLSDSVLGQHEFQTSPLLTQVIDGGKPVSIADTKNWDALPLGDEYCELVAGMQSCILTPLRNATTNVGILFLAWCSPHVILADELRLLNAVAEMAGAGIHRVTLHEQTEHQAAELALAYDRTLEGWAHALALRDTDTETHTQRVVEMTMKLARAFGISGDDLVQVRRGALLHDIGKMGIPDDILRKPGPLTLEEWLIMRQHPALAQEMLDPIPYLREAMAIPYCHHEKWDGSGYPRGLRGDQIPIAARLFAVADVWDALTSDRPYREAWSESEVRAYIQEQSSASFDPQVVRVFLDLL